MKTNLTLFAQIIQTLCRNSFNTLTENHQTDKHNKGIDSWTHLITMLFCQFSKLNSLHDVTNGLKSASGNLNHLGLKVSPSKSSLSYQNQNREWQLFQDYYFKLLHKTKENKVAGNANAFERVFSDLNPFVFHSIIQSSTEIRLFFGNRTRTYSLLIFVNRHFIPQNIMILVGEEHQNI